MLYPRHQASLGRAVVSFREHMWREPDMQDQDDLRLLGIYRKTRHFCSGPCCGNPRRHFGNIKGKTLNERKHIEQENEYYGT